MFQIVWPSNDCALLSQMVYCDDIFLTKTKPKPNTNKKTTSDAQASYREMQGDFVGRLQRIAKILNIIARLQILIPCLCC